MVATPIIFILNFQFQILKQPYLGSVRAECHETKGIWVNKILDPICDLSFDLNLSFGLLDFQIRILTLLYVRNGWCYCFEMKGIWIDRIMLILRFYFSAWRILFYTSYVIRGSVWLSLGYDGNRDVSAVAFYFFSLQLEIKIVLSRIPGCFLYNLQIVLTLVGTTKIPWIARLGLNLDLERFWSINSLCPSDTIWPYWSRLTLAQVV